MVPIPSLTVVGNLKEIIGDVVDGELVEEAIERATLEFESNVPNDAWVKWGGELKRFGIIRGRFDGDGNVVNDDDGPLRLVAQDDGLNIRGLQWRCSIKIPNSVIPLRPAGKLRSFWFNATGDGTEVDLYDVVPAVGLPISGVSGGGGGDNEYKEYANLAAFPATGAGDRIYVALDNGKFYRWTGSTYNQIGGLPISWSDVLNKPAYVAAGSTQEVARDAIGAAVATKSHLIEPGWVEGPDYMAIPRYPAIATFGDSALGNNYFRGTWNGTSQSRYARFTCYGPLNTSMIWNDQPASSWTFAVGGTRSDETLTLMPQYLADYQPQIVMLHTGGNDLIQGKTAAQVFPNIVACVRLAWAAGCKVILFNVIPVTGYSPTQKTQMFLLNKMLNGFAMMNPTNLALVDEYSILANPLTGGYKTGYSLSDGIHPNGTGGWALGKALETALDRFIGNKATTVLADAASYDGNLMANGLLAGTAPSYVFPNTGVSGQGASSWFFMGSASTDANSTHVLSKVTADDGYGEWQQVSTTRVANALSGAQMFALATGWAVGDVVQGSVRFETDASGWQNGKFDAYMWAYGADTSNVLYMSNANFEDESGLIPFRPERGILTTPAFVIPPGTLNLQFTVTKTNLGTVRWGRPAVRKLNKVAF